MKDRFSLNRYPLESIIALFTLLTLSFFLIFTKGNFLSPVNVGHIIGNFVPLSLTALALLLLLRRGDVDLSVGSIAGLAGFLCAYLSGQAGVHPIAALFIALLGGLVAGLINCALVVLLKRFTPLSKLSPLLPSLLVTLGSMFALRRLNWLLSGKEVELLESPLLNSIFTGNLGRVGIAALLIAFIAGVILYNKYAGREAGASGLSASSLSMISYLTLGTILLLLLFFQGQAPYLLVITFVAAALLALPGAKMGSFALSGLLAALAGIIITNRMSGASPYGGANYELNSLLIVLLAGATFFRGSTAKVGGVVSATLWVTLCGSGLMMLGFTFFANPFVKVALLALFLLFDFLLFKMVRKAKGV